MKFFKGLLIFIGYILCFSCKKPKVEAPTMSISTSVINIGEINNSSKALDTLRKIGEGTITYTATSDKNWLKIDKISGIIGSVETISFYTITPASDLINGLNKAVVTIVATINGVAQPAVSIIVSGNYKLSTIIADPSPIDFGTISKNAESYLKITKSGLENISYKVSADKPWITLSKTDGSLTNIDSLKVTVSPPQGVAGTQNGNIIFTPTVNGVVLPNVVVPVNVVFEILQTGDILEHTLTQDETWYGFVNLKGNVIVPVGKTLSFKPGTVIKVDKLENPILVTINGTLKMNGSTDFPIICQSVADKRSYYDWLGINVNGDVELSYLYIANARFAVDFGNTNKSVKPTKAPIIHHVLFEKIGTALTHLNSEFTIDFNNLTFNDMIISSIFTQAAVSGKATIFNLHEVNFYSGTEDIINTGNNFSLNLKNCNFSQKNTESSFHIENFGASNFKVTATNCYKLSAFKGFDVSNSSVSQTSQANSLISNIGSGIDQYINKNSRKR